MPESGQVHRSSSKFAWFDELESRWLGDVTILRWVGVGVSLLKSTSKNISNGSGLKIECQNESKFDIQLGCM